MDPSKAESMAALDAMLAEGAPPGAGPPPPPDDGSTVTCGACGTLIETVTGAPVDAAPPAAAPAPVPAGGPALPF